MTMPVGGLSTVSLTRRGWVVVVLVVVAVGSAFVSGPRGLNAVVVPGVIVLVAGFAQALRYEPPVVTRELPRRAHRGETVVVRLHVTAEKPFAARVRDTVSAGVEAVSVPAEATIADTTLRYEVVARKRGPQRVGPVRVFARDVFGVVEREFVVGEEDDLLVLPYVYSLEGHRRDDLVELYGALGDDRQHFYELRLYERGDPVRDIHWRSTAKQPGMELVVKEFSADESTRTVEVAVGSTPGAEDWMADAAASIIVHLHEAGVQVGLSSPDGRVAPTDRTDHRIRLLDHLALVGWGRADGSVDPDIVVEASLERVVVRFDGRVTSFSEVAGREIAREDGGPRAPLTAARRIRESLAQP